MEFEEFKSLKHWLYRMMHREVRVIYKEYLWRLARNAMDAEMWLGWQQGRFNEAWNQAHVSEDICLAVWHEVIP